ncbi:DUF349 domain-containing protein [Chromatiaceae bacterium AAb-1]|nr:DUF349 domain-containing protein [Chromatiaceae bacterium AAb-1]
MIFKRWFKPKWQHQDAAIRLQAISELQTAEPEYKKVLHELAFNDGAEQVRRAALQQLDEFSLWWQASKQDPAERLKQYAEQQLIGMLLENKVSAALKQQFIAQCNRSSILEQLALTENDAAVKFMLLQRLDKPELTLKSLLDPVLSVSQKLQLLESVQDEKQLEKLSRQSDGELQQHVQQKLQALEEQKQLPLKLRKQLTLLLARLNALRERHNIAEVPDLLQSLRNEWQTLVPQLGCLGTDAAEFSAKYQKLEQQLAEWLAPRLQLLEQQQAEQQAAVEKDTFYQQISQQLTTVRNQLATALLNTDLTAAEALSQQVEQIQQHIADADQNDTRQQQLRRSAAQLAKQLNELPLIAEKLISATRLLTDWATQPLPDSADSYQQSLPLYQKWLRQWQQLNKGLGIELPESLKQSYTELADTWQQVCNGFKAEHEKQYKLCRNKLSEFRRLYDAGKYKVLFGLFKGIEADYSQLSVSQQQQLAKDYEFATSKLAELSDWQEYIATPRKQALLAQVQQLAATVLTDASTRAREVKQARELWKSLGRAEAALDAELNSAFDQACEAAFEPCREHFARMDAERETNAQARLEIIQQLQQLAEVPEAKTLDAEIARLTQAWQKTGPVDKARFTELFARYQQALKPLKQRIKLQQQDAFNAKQALIEQAAAAAVLEDAAMAAKVLKECQQQWKTLGFAGKGRDQALWQQFRQLCDTFFNARTEQFKQQQQAEQEEQHQTEQALTQFTAELEQVKELTALTELETRIRQFAVDKSRSQQQAVRVLSEKLKLKQQQLLQQKDNADIRLLLDILDSDRNVTAEQLPARYRDTFNQPQGQNLNRLQLTLALEIISGKNSPQQDSSARQQVQLLLLSDKHNQGEELTTAALFKRWLQFGPVAENEKPLLQRVTEVLLNT